MSELESFNLVSASKKKKFNKSTTHTQTNADDKIVIPTLGQLIFMDANNYTWAKRNWKFVFASRSVKLHKLLFNSNWQEFFDIVSKKPYFPTIERILTEEVFEKNADIYPYPELLFTVFNILSPSDINVVILGQDPYPDSKVINKVNVPQATGISFSVPISYPQPSSVRNIFTNLLEFGHIKSYPKGGCLINWVLQGCFMINSALTTVKKQPTSHSNTWASFTADLLKYISDKCNNIVFLAWGKNAHMLCLNNVDFKKHKFVTSSHPSGYSYKNTMNGFCYEEIIQKGKAPTKNKPCTYPAFSDTDHFGEANNILSKYDKRPIYWDVIDATNSIGIIKKDK